MKIVTKIRWPKMGDRPFKDKSADMTSPTWCSLNWMSNLGVSDSLYAEAFKEAGDKIINELEREEKAKHPDMYFFPIAFLYRHCLELQMKNIIRLGIWLKLISDNEELSGILGSHNLHLLWSKAKAVITKYWPDGDEKDIKAAECIILDFHSIDKTGQNLRYSEDKSGNKTVRNMPGSVQLIDLKDVFEAIYNFFNGCEAGLQDGLDTMKSMEQDLGNFY